MFQFQRMCSVVYRKVLIGPTITE
uniref:Uncharacterized protein n=1 Tax=Arundo donax TaxID=35708 RepID=A0A0A9B6J0_ARUDO